MFPSPPAPTLIIRGIPVFRGYLSHAAQRSLVNDVRKVVRAAPFFQPETRFGQKMSVRMSAAGNYGWFSDRRGYRYIAHHPRGTAWPPIPESILGVWSEITGLSRQPECCLINFYTETARMGLHQDRDETDFRWPVLSISLGDSGRFRIGSVDRGGPTESLWLDSGDVLMLSGPARLIHHGIDRIRPGSSSLLPKSGRLNLTLRVVT
ncbi:alkylated DNA repair protein (DNA oxidative demethylase) [Rhodovulum imhoffii]|uniref:Alkylated DNA repair protein (DNA oxidative demethylase) n=1 Tax=Rhodovulum imhoffii TaxID=365340 RepID=A0A2T5BPD0_9RHOB|nr:alpha-ketoglutarate-dependent dioxygenase AlkB [Rhodovulum imhoffii]MBK5932925.1 alkylated DNA repair dioxygenase [Rhodovulum imhoffii]PTN00861.1 alkylated DNA repair protein (DNA oxidative demethylase) [Rhodovulum imhoffii]